MGKVSNNQKRLLRMHEIEKRSWHVIAKEIGVNVAYVYNYAMHGIKPTNKLIRVKLGMKTKHRIKKISMIAKLKLFSGLNEREINFILKNRKRMNE